MTIEKSTAMTNQNSTPTTAIPYAYNACIHVFKLYPHCTYFFIRTRDEVTSLFVILQHLVDISTTVYMHKFPKQSIRAICNQFKPNNKKQQQKSMLNKCMWQVEKVIFYRIRTGNVCKVGMPAYSKGVLL